MAERSAYEDEYDEYDDDPREDDCDHESYDADFNGEAFCHRCGHRWYLTAEEMTREHERQAAYDDECRKWERERRIREWRDWLLSPITRAWRWAFPRKPVEIDDEIPF